MIRIVPAMDIIDGKCVRLTQGDYNRQSTYSDNPLEMAKKLEDSGFKYLHLVQLDNAKVGRVADTSVLQTICSATSLTVDYGGGISSEADMERILNAGASQVNVGSWSVKSQTEFWKATARFGKKIILSADVKNEKIAVNGWQSDTGIHLFDFLEENSKAGIEYVTCTDISRDGALTGPATDLYVQIKSRFPDLFLTASGGVRHISDIEALNEKEMDAVIVGKAIYEGHISLEDLSKLNQDA